MASRLTPSKKSTALWRNNWRWVWKKEKKKQKE
jgi:hypothetical protein